MKQTNQIKKLLTVVLAALFSTSALAAGPVTGRATLTMWMDGFFDSAPTGAYVIEIWEQDGVIVGNPGFTRLVSTKDGYQGWFRSKGVNFSCGQAIANEPGALGCSDRLAATNADLVVRKNGELIEGNVNFRSVKAERNTKGIKIYADGALDLTRKADGLYVGSGSLNASPTTRASRVELRTSGTLKDLQDPALFSIFLISTLVEQR